MTTNASSSTTNQWLLKAAARLQKAGIATARLDCLVLLEDATGKDRTHLLAHPETKLINEQLSLLDDQIERRLRHEPLAYVRGKTEFYGREFAVNAHTLAPRPETEDMVDLLKTVWQPGMTIIDVGTGSGAIGITAALELGTTAVELIDIDQSALAIARENLKKYGLKLGCRYGDLLKGAPARDIILANLPYVPDSHTINQAAMQEPKHAIFGGSDGLDLYRRLFGELALPKPKYILTESLPFQHDSLASIAQNCGYQLTQTAGFVQLFTLGP